jgi:hypothetical protein
VIAGLWYFIRWSGLTDAQAILLTGFLAAVIAVWALFSQRAITRRQVTFEHIARLEADGDSIKARLKVAELTVAGNLAQWAAATHDQSPERQALTTRFNEFELLAIGIQRGIIDFELYKRWFKSGTVRAWHNALPFVMALRNRVNNHMLYYEFEVLAKWLENDTKPPRRSSWRGSWF